MNYSIIQGPDGLYYVVDSNTGASVADTYLTIESAQAAMTALMNADNSFGMTAIGFIFPWNDSRAATVFIDPAGKYWYQRYNVPNQATPGDTFTPLPWTSAAEANAALNAAYVYDRAAAAQQDAAFNKQMATVFAVVGAAVGAAALVQSGALASWIGSGDVPAATGSVAATDSASVVSAAATEVPTASAGWVSSGDLPFTATEAAGGTISAPTSIMLSDTPSWMDTASTVAKATAGAVTSSGGISAGGVLSTLATIAKALTGGAKPAVRSGINPATGLPFDSSAANAQSIQGMLPYLLIGGLALIALRGK